MTTQHKIIFAGPMNAGKTTAIASISDVNVTKEAAEKTRNNANVAMDYGVMKLGGVDNIHLYGTPDEEQIEFVRDALTEDGIGLVLLLNNTNKNPFEELKFYTDAFAELVSKGKLVIGVNFMSRKPRPCLEDYYTELERLNIKAPIFEVDCRQYNDVSILVQSLLYSCDPWLGVQ